MFSPYSLFVVVSCFFDVFCVFLLYRFPCFCLLSVFYCRVVCLCLSVFSCFVC